jgi:galactarate dehydratase
MRTFVQIKPEDNVAIAVKELPKGTEIMPGVTTLNDIPQAHKIALTDIPKDQPVIRYGVTLGYALDDIAKGQWINEYMLRLPTPPSLDDMPWGTNLRTDLPEPPVKTWWGYRNPEGGYAGTRNILGIQTTVQCVEGTLNVALERIRKELLPKYPHVDDVVAINHAYGCGVAINAPEAKVPIRALRTIAHHPNFGGELMLVSL